ncbi:MAG: glycine cleavage system protein H [Flammeovirgaceae bacterium]|nr:glycine cleavage system protein H [Flammeovirgaceae bacterium]
MIKIDKYTLRSDVFYDKENHFWINVTGNKAVIGLSPLIQEINGHFVALLLSEPGIKFNRGESIGSAEAEKHVGPLKAPVSGTVLSVNTAVLELPRLINEDSFGQGWLMEIELTDWERESAYLVHGENEIKNWAAAELKKFNEKGWIAQ